jgi:thymidine kinase
VKAEPGRLEVIAGPMFAGKTEELLRRVRRTVVGGRTVQVFTHALDKRGGRGRVASHAGLDHPSVEAASAQEIEQAVRPEIDLAAIDEAHFFGADLVGVVSRLAERGVVVVVAGLDVTFDGLPFEPLPSLMALAERVDKLTAICAVCGAEAIYHTRVEDARAEATDLVAEHVGGSEKYQARCRRHFNRRATSSRRDSGEE